MSRRMKHSRAIVPPRGATFVHLPFPDHPCASVPVAALRSNACRFPAGSGSCGCSFRSSNTSAVGAAAGAASGGNRCAPASMPALHRDTHRYDARVVRRCRCAQHVRSAPATSPKSSTPMSQPDLELMLWALSHGWRVSVFSGPTPGSLWRDPARRRFLVHAPGRAADLPVLSEEVRTRLLEARGGGPAPPGLSHGIYPPVWPLAHRLAPVGVFLRSVPAATGWCAATTSRRTRATAAIRRTTACPRAICRS